MRYALIGCGKISSKHIEAAKNNNIEIAAICDIIPESMENLADKFSLSDGVKRYTDYNELIENERPDIAAIATNSGTHAHIAMDFISAKCNVIIEKPIALSIKDAECIINLAKENGVTVCVNHQNRFNISVQRIRSAVEAGHFGKLFHAAANIRWNRNEYYYSQASWKGTWEQDGGALMNQCIHNVDLLRWMMGNEIDEVFAYTDNLNHPYIEAEDIGIAVVKFKNGSYGVIEGTTNIFPKSLEETLSIFGEKGTVKLSGKSIKEIEEWFFLDELPPPPVADIIIQRNNIKGINVYNHEHTLLYADMIDAIQTGREPYVTAYDGKRAIELVLAIYKSAYEGHPVKLPLKYGSTVDFKRTFN